MDRFLSCCGAKGLFAEKALCKALFMSKDIVLPSRS